MSNETLRHLQRVLPYAEAELESLAGAARKDRDPEIQAELERCSAMVHEAQEHLHAMFNFSLSNPSCDPAARAGSADRDQEKDLLEDGHAVYGFCADCGSALAQCDVPTCKAEAYKFLDGIGQDTAAYALLMSDTATAIEDVCKDDAFYFCERHCEVWRPVEHFTLSARGGPYTSDNVVELYEDDEDPDHVVMYWPGSRQECKTCDFPY